MSQPPSSSLSMSSEIADCLVSLLGSLWTTHSQTNAESSQSPPWCLSCAGRKLLPNEDLQKPSPWHQWLSKKARQHNLPQGQSALFDISWPFNHRHPQERTKVQLIPQFCKRENSNSILTPSFKGFSWKNAWTWDWSAGRTTGSQKYKQGHEATPFTATNQY